MTSQMFTGLVTITVSAKDAVLGTFAVLAVNSVLSLFLLSAVIKKSRRYHLLFYFNIIMLLSTIAESIVEILFLKSAIDSKLDLPLFIAVTFFICIIKILVELILILRLYTLHPERYFLLTACMIFVALRAFIEVFSQALFFIYGFQDKYWLMFIIEPFMGAANIVFFSSIFILTLVGRIRTIKKIRQHRLFPFIVLAIENMIVPCVTSSILAIYSLYVHDDITVLYRNIIMLIHICVTVASIIMTTLLGSSSSVQHHTLEKLGTHMNPMDRQLRTLSMAAGIKELTRVDNEELRNEFRFSYWGTEEAAIVNV